MLAEARRLHKDGLSYRRMKQLGLEYRYEAFVLDGTLSKEDMLAQLEAKIWQYAKRQLTYWKRNKEIYWFAPTDSDAIMSTVTQATVHKTATEPVPHD